jgi:hypothetical protein
MNVTGALTSVGALGGLTYAVTKGKSFWITAGFTILFAIGGGAIGTAYEAFYSK